MGSDRTSAAFKFYFTVNMFAETAAPSWDPPAGLDGVLGVYGPTVRNSSFLVSTLVLLSPNRGGKEHLEEEILYKYS